MIRSMQRPSPRPSLLLTTFIKALSTVGRAPIDKLDAAGIAKARAARFPRSRVAQLVIGRIDPSVVIASAVAPTRDGASLPLRVYRPGHGDAPMPVVVFFHGGGWVQGNVVNYDPICTSLAAGLGALVVSVDYRMAPEHAAPTAAYDCIDVTDWLTRRAGDFGGDPRRLAVAGDSAGGNLAAVVTMAFRDQDRDEIRAQALIYPATDMTMSSPSIDEHANAPILTKANMLAFRAHYLGSAPGALTDRDPLVSPLFGRLDSLPPALIQTADLDPLRDDGIRYAAALESAGVTVRLTNYLGAPHGFTSFPGVYRSGAASRSEMIEFLRGYLNAPTSAPGAGSGSEHVDPGFTDAQDSLGSPSAE